MRAMVKPSEHGRRGAELHPPSTGTISLPVMGQAASRVRPSRMGRWRAVSLVAVHLLIIGHIIHWLASGKTLSPVEPSEAMYTLNDGHVNAGFIFFAAALAVTLVFGRFVCGWGCHVIAYQDLCAWILKKIGIKPKPLRSRLLVLAPLALAIYMFVWPTLYRWWMAIPAPELSNHLMKTEFWETFPGPTIAVITILVCGFAIVYFLGSKGFCTYACPYGGFFALAERVAPGRIRVTDACEHCGHCTAACTSNVRVHEEVARYGMVVDPGCMKCMDCVSVCPNDALYLGFGRPPMFARTATGNRGPAGAAPRRARPRFAMAAGLMRALGTKRWSNRGGWNVGAEPPGAPQSKGGGSYDFSLGEEALMAVVGVATLLAFRGLYGQIPLLLAMAMAAITAYTLLKLSRLVRSANVRLQSYQLKRGGRLTRSGAAFAAFSLILLAFTLHSGAVQYNVWSGHRALQSLQLGDEVWAPTPSSRGWWPQASSQERALALAAIARLELAERIGLSSTPSALTDLVWLYLAKDETNQAEATLKRLVALIPDQAAPYRGLAGVYRKTGQTAAAERFYQEALRIDPGFEAARNDLAAMYYVHGMEQLNQRNIDAAIEDLTRAATTQPQVVLYQYNLAVATFMGGHPEEALPPLRAALRLEPNDEMARGFEKVILQELGKARRSRPEASPPTGP